MDAKVGYRWKDDLHFSDIQFHLFGMGTKSTFAKMACKKNVKPYAQEA
jgi:hypothetical protein